MGGFLVQSSHGAKGNFELVVPRTGGGLAHWFRKNDDPSLPWVGPTLMFGGTDDVDAAALIQSNFANFGSELNIPTHVGHATIRQTSGGVSCTRSALSASKSSWETACL